CASRSLCVAVGSELYGSDGDLELAELWNGARWLAQPAATQPSAPRQGELDLSGVACTSLVKCMIVGQFRPLSTSVPETFAERWAGGGWSPPPTPNPQPSGAPPEEDMLPGVSCVQSTCIAVGSAQTNNQFQPLIEQYS